MRIQGLCREHIKAREKQLEQAQTPINKQAERLEGAMDRNGIKQLEREVCRKGAVLVSTAAPLMFEKSEFILAYGGRRVSAEDRRMCRQGVSEAQGLGAWRKKACEVLCVFRFLPLTAFGYKA